MAEEGQDIIGKIPPATVRYGNTVILGVLLLLLGVCGFIPAHETRTVAVHMGKGANGYQIETLVSAYGYGELHIGQRVQIDVECYPASQYGYMWGKITDMDTVITNGGYMIQIDIPSEQPTFEPKQRLEEMTGTGTIVVNEYNLLQKIFGWTND